MTTRIVRAVVGAAAGLGALASTAAGQDALGDGRALDNSLSSRNRYNVQRPDLQAEIDFRNAIVTGNAPGGLSFRGDVGYGAAREFRDVIGADDLFPFRRDSLYSGLAGMGIRGTEALQYQFSLTTGARPPQNLVGSLQVNRSYSGTGAATPDLPAMPGPEELPVRERSPLDPAYDDRGAMLWALRSPGAYLSSEGLRPSLLLAGPVSDQPGAQEIGVIASPLRGIRLTPLADEERPLPGEDLLAPTRAEPDRPDDGRVDPLRPETGEQSGRVPTAYDEVLGRMMDAAAGLRGEGEEEAPSFGDRMLELQRQLLVPGATQDRPEPDRPAPGPDLAVPEAPEDPDDEDAPQPAAGSLHFDPQTMSLLRQTGEPVTDFVRPGVEGRDIFSEHMRTGQRLLAEGRYFDAEERFTRAIATRPGDVNAQVGRIHSQIGGAMILSAALNLRTLILEHPEVTGVRYGQELLPRAERVPTLLNLLREKASVGVGEDGRARPGSGVGKEAGLLLAYLGYQLGMEDAVRDGFEAMRLGLEDETARVGKPTVDARLVDLLENVWMPRPSGGAGERDGGE